MGRGDLKFLAAIGHSLVARCVVQLVRRIASPSSDRLGYACRRETCLVSQTTLWTISGIWRADLDIFWRDRSALVRNAAQPVMPFPWRLGTRRRRTEFMGARKIPHQWKQLRWAKRCRVIPPSPRLRRTSRLRQQRHVARAASKRD